MQSPDYHDDAGHIVGPMPTFGPIAIDPNDVSPPFAICRISVLYDAPAVDSGEIDCRKTQRLVHCLVGACSVIVDGVPHPLNSPNKGVTIGPDQRYHLDDFTSGSLVLVYADQWLR